MMRSINRTVAALGATALVSVGAIAPAAATAKTASFTITSGKLKLAQGGKFTGSASGTFGKGTVSGTAVPPRVTMTLRVKGGTITAVSSKADTVGGKVRGSFTLKGTGKFRKIKGKGSFTGNPGSFVFVWKGKATY